MKNTSFTIVAALSMFAFTNNALSQAVETATPAEATVTALATETETAESFASPMERIAAVCALREKIVLTKNAIKACDGDEAQMPALSKNGSRFLKGRTGAEFNTLIANFAAFQ